MWSFFITTELHFIIFYVITILWILEFIVFPSSFKSNDYLEKKSFYFILLTIVFTIVLNFILGWYKIGVLSMSIRPLFYVLGLILYSFGLIIRYTAIFTLGKYFTRDVSIDKEHQLISNGLYKRLRHPSYVGLLLLTISVPLFFSNILVLVISSVLMFLSLNYRMQLEESNMEQLIGPTYSTWRNSRYRFIPFIY
jgi:protein-S-isoprenylcysteine O-methyltransferase Ste14